jgi:hypothetical protein
MNDENGIGEHARRMVAEAMNTQRESVEVAGAKEAERSTPPYTADNGDSKSVAAVGRSSACAHEGYYYCKKCGEDLTPDIREQHGLYNDSPGAARSVS